MNAWEAPDATDGDARAWDAGSDLDVAAELLPLVVALVILAVVVIVILL